MKSIYNKAIVAASMLMACSGAMAQELNSAYYRGCRLILRIQYL